MTKENENTVDEKSSLPNEQLTDLPVLDEQAKQAKGGPTLNFTKIEYKYTPFDDQHRA